MIVNLQALRALAAYAVVLYHIGDYKPAASSWFSRMSHIGAAGVDVFFVLSGFIMVFTTRRSSMSGPEFLSRRIRRIVPTYWVMTLVTFSLLLLGYEPLGNHEVDIGYLISSLLFIPVERAGAGAIPLVAVGWTLNFEMLFYFVFASASATVGTARRAHGVAATLLALVALGYLIEPFDVVLRTFTSPLLFEFLFGVALAQCWEGLARLSARVLRWAGVVSGLVGVAALVTIGLSVPFEALVGPWRFAWLGGPAVAIVGAALLLEAGGRTLSSKLWLLQGDASYSLYLVHPLVLQMTRKALDRLPIDGTGGLAVQLVVLLGACGVGGTLFNKHVERPLSALLLRRSQRAVRGVVEGSG